MDIHYRIQEREFSANIIERGVGPGNKPKEIRWNVFLMPVIQPGEGTFKQRKEKMDATTRDLLVYFNTIAQD